MPDKQNCFAQAMIVSHDIQITKPPFCLCDPEYIAELDLAKGGLGASSIEIMHYGKSKMLNFYGDGAISLGFGLIRKVAEELHR